MAKRLRLFGHPLHPATTHAPLALLMVVPVWDALAAAGVGGPWWTTAYWCGIAGLVASAPAFLTGMIDLPGVPGRALGLAIAHLMTMATIVLVSLISILALHGHASLPGAAHPTAALVVDAIAAVALAVGGWLGGQLVYGHGVGVKTIETMDATSTRSSDG
jgi:uncharacterized membrane protein